jgi:DNA-binding MarR family transcriptional regulator
MSLRHMIKAFDCKIGSHVQKLVLIKLADNANEDGKCWPSLKRIANDCEISRRTTINAIKSLEEKGFLQVHREKTSADMNKVNLYTLTLEGGELNALGGASPALGGGESPAPRTSHSFEPPKEPVSVNPDGHTQSQVKEEMQKGFEAFWECWKVCKKKMGVKNRSTIADTRKKWDKYFTPTWWKSHTLDDFEREVNAVMGYADEIHDPEDEFCPAKNMMTGTFFTREGWVNE